MILRKAQSQYISWVLILAMIMGISYLLYNWSINQAQKTSENLVSRTDPIICSEVGIFLNGICQSFSTLKLNVTNSKTLDIEGLQIRTIGLYSEDQDYLDTMNVEHKIITGDQENIEVIKTGTLSQVKIIPFVKKKNKNIYCEDKSIKKERILQC